MARCQNGAQCSCHVLLMVHRTDDRTRRSQRWINSRARRHGPIGGRGMIEQFLRELHCPWEICDPPVKFSVDKIGAAPEEKTNRCGYNQIIAEICPRDFVPMCVIKSKQQQSKHSPVA